MEKETISHLKPGSTLQNGRYTITRMIGAGGFGCTYEVSSGNNRYCVKEFFMSQNCTRNAQTGMVSIINTSQIDLVNRSKKKFLEEATVLRMMQHPSIVHVVDIFEENGTAYFVMDYIEGQSLQALVCNSGPINEAEAISYMQQVANALEFVHRNNRLHLDIKPDNIMIDPYGRAILIDFGASKFIDKDSAQQTSAVFQTPGYAPLEQVNADVNLFGPYTDIYGIGATFYKALSGVTPLSSPERADGSELAPLPDNISPATRNAVMEALQLNRRKRPQSAKAFIEMITPEGSDEVTVDEVTEVTADNVEYGDEVAVEVFEAADVNPNYVVPNPPANFPPHRKDRPQKKITGTQIGIFAIIVLVIILIILLVMLMQYI